MQGSPQRGPPWPPPPTTSGLRPPNITRARRTSRPALLPRLWHWRATGQRVWGTSPGRTLLCVWGHVSGRSPRTSSLETREVVGGSARSREVSVFRQRSRVVPRQSEFLFTLNVSFLKEKNCKIRSFHIILHAHRRLPSMSPARLTSGLASLPRRRGFRPSRRPRRQSRGIRQPQQSPLGSRGASTVSAQTAPSSRRDCAQAQMRTL